MTEAVSMEKKLDDLATAMIEAATKADCKLSDRLEVFKICSQHYVNVAKVKGKLRPDDESGGMTMGGLRNRVANGAQGDTNEPTDPDSE